MIVLKRAISSFQISSYSPAYVRIIYDNKKKQTNKQTKSQVLLGPPLGKQNIQVKEAYYAAYLLNLLKYVSVMLLRYHVKKTLFVFLIVVRQ